MTNLEARQGTRNFSGAPWIQNQAFAILWRFRATPRHRGDGACAYRRGCRGAYARSDLFERRRELMEAWAGYLTLAEKTFALNR